MACKADRESANELRRGGSAVSCVALGAAAKSALSCLSDHAFASGGTCGHSPFFVADVAACLSHESMPGLGKFAHWPGLMTLR